MSKLLRTPFFARHQAAGARLIEFGGWEMPVQYRGIIAEHEHTRTAVSLFDCSHMGQFRVQGAAAGAALDAVLPRRASTQKPWTCRYNFLTNEQGGVIDDIIVYRLDGDEYYIVVNASTQDNDFDHLRRHLPAAIRLTNESAATAKLDLQGPEALAVVAGIGLEAADLPRYYRARRVTIADVPMLISRTGYTGERGLEFYFDAAHADRIWDLLSGLPNVEPAGLGARDTLRLELALPLYGHELDENTTPVEAGFGRFLDLDHDFVGQAALRREPRRELVGLTLDGRRAARAHDRVCDPDGNDLGEVTSGSFAPSVGAAVALAYVRPDSVDVGARAQLQGARKPLSATVSALPFYRDGTARK